MLARARDLDTAVAEGRFREDLFYRLTRKLTYTVVLEEDPPGHWHTYAPAVPGCFGGGRTRAEALRRYRAALRLHLDELSAHGGAIPIERRSPAVQVVVAA